jgi:CBS domain-containing protein
MDEVDDDGDDELEIPEYSLMGLIDRVTLLGILESVVFGVNPDSSDKGLHVPSSAAAQAAIHASNFTSGGVRSDMVSREWVDAAWPNPQRTRESTAVLDRVRQAGIGRTVIDLRDFLHPDPLFISDRAPAHAAYKLFRRTGARHILVTDMRNGRLGGIISRKDILPKVVRKVHEKLRVTTIEEP